MQICLFRCAIWCLVVFFTVPVPWVDLNTTGAVEKPWHPRTHYITTMLFHSGVNGFHVSTCFVCFCLKQETWAISGFFSRNCSSEWTAFQVFHMWFLFYGRSGQYNVSINCEPFYFIDEATQKTLSEVKDAISAYGKARQTDWRRFQMIGSLSFLERRSMLW